MQLEPFDNIFNHNVIYHHGGNLISTISTQHHISYDIHIHNAIVCNPRFFPIRSSPSMRERNVSESTVSYQRWHNANICHFVHLTYHKMEMYLTHWYVIVSNKIWQKRLKFENCIDRFWQKINLLIKMSLIFWLII